MKSILTFATLLFCTLSPAQDQDAEMKAMMEAATPGKPHEILGNWVGEWTTKTQVYPGPGAPAMESTGSASAQWTLGKRFVASIHKGNMMGMDYEGHGLDGYDNVKQCYVGTWTDSMSTAIISLTGQLSKDGKVLTMEGKMDEPATGEKGKPFKFISTFKSKDEIHFQIEDVKAGFKMMEMTYTRKK
jgi:hypothetical protein